MGDYLNTIKAAEEIGYRKGLFIGKAERLALEKFVAGDLPENIAEGSVKDYLEAYVKGFVRGSLEAADNIAHNLYKLGLSADVILSVIGLRASEISELLTGNANTSMFGEYSKFRL